MGLYVAVGKGLTILEESCDSRLAPMRKWAMRRRRLVRSERSLGNIVVKGGVVIVLKWLGK